MGFIKAVAVAGLLLVGPMAGAAMAAPDAAIVLDGKTGKVLYADNPDAPRHPASLTKMMTLYLLFQALDKGKTTLDSQIPVSAHAANEAPSKLGFQPGQTISVRDAILAIVTKSANDVAMAIAEYLGGSERNFCAMMNAQARSMGMTNTSFVNPNGLPDPEQLTTARDLATLARALREHYPEYYSYFSTPSFVWHGRRISNHDHLLGHIAGVNGIKTGYTRTSGFNLATSVDRDGRQFIGVVLGGETGRQRDNRMASLVDKYLPLASRNTRVANIVPGGPQTAVAQAQKPAIGQVKVAAAMLPIPRLRPTEDAAPAAEAADAGAPDTSSQTVAENASAYAADDANAPAPAVAAAASEVPSPSAPTSVASLIGANSPLALQGADDAAAAQQQATAPQQVAEASPPTADAPEGDAAANDESIDADPPAAHKGWRIQIAASPSQAAAEDMLDQALSKAGKVLAHASPYTEPVASTSGTLYRARFAGFTSKEAARNACTYLAKQKFSCLAINN